MGLTEILGLVFIVGFFALMLVFSIRSTGSARRYLRDIPAFAKLGRSIGIAVEAGQRLHIGLGHGGIDGELGASTLVGLSMLKRIARAASISDRPPVATSGEAVQSLLSQDTLRDTYHEIGAETQYHPSSGLLCGVTPYSYAAGVIPVINDQQVSANVLVGHFGSEAALIIEAADRNGSLTLAGSDDLTGQAVLYVAAQEPLIGEELFAGGAYLQAGPAHLASVRAQDILRWVLVLAILASSALKLVGVW